jgi:hypothetical protein
MTLQERIEAAIKRVTSGQAPMRVPVEETDVDIVLGDCAAMIADLQQKLREHALISSEIKTRFRDGTERYEQHYAYPQGRVERAPDGTPLYGTTVYVERPA